MKRRRVTDRVISHRVVPAGRVLATALALASMWTLPPRAAAAARLDWVLGPTDGRGNIDGTGHAARFAGKLVLAADPYRGGLLVADTYANTIRRIDADGRVTTLAGRSGESGHRDGAAAQALFDGPESVAVDRAGNVYVADGQNHVIRRIAPGGTVSTLAGKPDEEGNADGRGAAARFRWPKALAIAADGRLWVSDTYNDALRRVSVDGQVETLRERVPEAEPGTQVVADAPVPIEDSGVIAAPPMPVEADVAAAAAAVVAADAAWVPVDHADAGSRLLGAVRAIAAAADGRMFVANDYGVYRVADGTAESVLAMPASADGAALESVAALAVAADGTVYLTDGHSGAVFALPPGGTLTRLFAPAGEEGEAFGSLAVGRDGRLYAGSGSAVVAIAGDGRTETVAGYDRDGAMAIRLAQAGSGFDSIARARDGSLYVTRRLDNVVIRLDRDGRLRATIGQPGKKGKDNGPAERARLTYPSDLAFDGDGLLYIADGDSGLIRRVDAQGRVETYAGRHGDSQRRDGTLAEATFWKPQRLAFDRRGDLYVLDTSPYVGGRNEGVVRKVDRRAGRVSTVATFDDAIRAAVLLEAKNPGQLILPGGFVDIAVGARDELLVLDEAGVVWELAAGGLHARVLPDPQPLSAYEDYLESLRREDDDGGNHLIFCAFLFCGPDRLDAGADGTLYLSDSGNHTIMRIGADGRARVLAGTLGKRGNGVSGPLPSTLELPNGITVAGPGELLFVTEHGGVGVIRED